MRSPTFKIDLTDPLDALIVQSALGHAQLESRVGELERVIGSLKVDVGRLEGKFTVLLWGLGLALAAILSALGALLSMA